MENWWFLFRDTSIQGTSWLQDLPVSEHAPASSMSASGVDGRKQRWKVNPNPISMGIFRILKMEVRLVPYFLAFFGYILLGYSLKFRPSYMVGTSNKIGFLKWAIDHWYIRYLGNAQVYLRWQETESTRNGETDRKYSLDLKCVQGEVIFRLELKYNDPPKKTISTASTRHFLFCRPPDVFWLKENLIFGPCKSTPKVAGWNLQSCHSHLPCSSVAQNRARLFQPSPLFQWSKTWCIGAVPPCLSTCFNMLKPPKLELEEEFADWLNQIESDRIR